MEPLTATIEAIAARSAAAAESTRGALETSALNGLETTAEAREAIIGENGLTQQVDSIKFESLDALAARNEAGLEVRLKESSQIERNRIDGAEREDTVLDELEHEYPPEAGYHIEQQCSLRDKEGKVVPDPLTGESRRIDLVIIEDEKVVRSIEVTSETADKTKQLEKEERIREAGGNFIIDRRTDELVPFAPGVKTEIWRRA